MSSHRSEQRSECIMEPHLYVSLIPEAMIASHLSPEQFGQYYATGHARRAKGKAIFFEIDPTFRHDYFDLDAAMAQLAPHPDGRAKNSVYVSNYRVIEHVPVSALGTLYLATDYGATLGLQRSVNEPPATSGLHLYKELAPVNSLVASSLPPREFYESITVKPSKLLWFPALAFAELGIGELSDDPVGGEVGDLPYENIFHLREALAAVLEPGKTTKMVERLPTIEFPYRSVKAGSGFYYGNGHDLAFYAMPSVTQMRDRHQLWWRSANQ